MKSRLALAASIGAAALAVALVGVDYAFNIETRLETRNAAGEWVKWASSTDNGSRYIGPYDGCAGPEVRLVVHNGQLWGTNVDVDVSLNDADYHTVRLLHETWSLGGGETRTANFTVEGKYLQSTSETAPKPDGRHATLRANVGTDYGNHLSTCVQKEVPT